MWIGSIFSNSACSKVFLDCCTDGVAGVEIDWNCHQQGLPEIIAFQLSQAVLHVFLLAGNLVGSRVKTQLDFLVLVFSILQHWESSGIASITYL